MMIDSHEISDRARLLSHQLFVERLREEPDLLNVAKDAVARIAGSEGATLGEPIWLELLRADLRRQADLAAAKVIGGDQKDIDFAALRMRFGQAKKAEIKQALGNVLQRMALEICLRRADSASRRKCHG
jgi:hypothetical protein